MLRVPICQNNNMAVNGRKVSGKENPMPRFFIPPGEARPGCMLTLDRDASSHIARSLRMRAGETLTLSAGEGTDFEAEITDTGEAVTVRVLSESLCGTEPGTRTVLFQALPKGDKMDWIVQKATELGVYAIQPFLSSRCISRPDGKSMEKKRARLQKIAFEAAQQSGRGRVPEVRGLVDIKDLPGIMPEKTLFFYEKGGKRVAELLTPGEREVGLIVGSEGGFSPEEAAFLESQGAVPATLGARILRCETAPVCGLSVIFNCTGDI